MSRTVAEVGPGAGGDVAAVSAPPASDAVSAGERRVWVGALGCFVLAGLSGLAFRVGLVTGLPDAVSFEHLRHAHSHLMYFGWVTPPLMLLVARGVRARGRTIPGVEAVAALALGAGLLAFPAFLVAGYAPVEIGGLRMPLSVLAASLNGVAWYAFVWRFLRTTRGLPRDRALRLWDSAVALLALAPLGALARGVVDATGAGGPAGGSAGIAAFLSWFGDGWLVLAVMGAAWAASPGDERYGRWGQRLVLAGLSTAFLLHLPPSALSPLLRAGATTGGLLLAAGLLLLAAALWQPAGPWRVVVVFLVATALTRAGSTFPGLAAQPGVDGLRIVALHVLTLGVVTVGLVTAARARWGDAAVARTSRWAAASAVLLLTLLPVSGVLGTPGTSRLVLAAAGSLPLVAVASVDLVRLSQQAPYASQGGPRHGP